MTWGGGGCRSLPPLPYPEGTVVTFDTQTLLDELDALTDKVQAMAAVVARAAQARELHPTAEVYEAHDLLNSGAAHVRGAAAQIAKYQRSVTPVTDTLLAEQEEEQQ